MENRKSAEVEKSVRWKFYWLTMLLPHCILVNEIIAFVPIKQISNLKSKKKKIKILFHSDELVKQLHNNIAAGGLSLNNFLIISLPSQIKI